MEPNAIGPGISEELRVVVVSRQGAANRYVLGNLAGICRVEKLLTATGSKQRRTPRLAYERFKKSPLETVGKPGREAVLRRLESRLDREVAERLPQPDGLVDRAEAIGAADLNSDVGEAMMSDLAPDLMILSGAPLLKPRIFEIPRMGTVNLHWGISPDYRGDQSILTALRRHDYSAIGVTLHYVDEGVDTGPVLAQGRPPLHPSDTLADVWANTARAASTMLTEFVHRLRLGPVPGRRLSGDGIVVRGRDRRVWHHAQYAADRRFLQRHPPHTEGRITRYW